MITSHIYKGYQIHIPTEIRKKLDIKEDDKITWQTKNDEIIIKIKKQRNIKDLIGLATKKEGE